MGKECLTYKLFPHLRNNAKDVSLTSVCNKLVLLKHEWLVYACANAPRLSFNGS